MATIPEAPAELRRSPNEEIPLQYIDRRTRYSCNFSRQMALPAQSSHQADWHSRWDSWISLDNAASGIIIAMQAVVNSDNLQPQTRRFSLHAPMMAA
jgi:hypothetical protein